MSNVWYKDLVKTIAIEDNEIFEMFIDDMLQNLFHEKDLRINTLTNVDKLYMLLCIRSYCIGTSIVFTTKVPREDDEGKKEDVKVDVPLSLNEVLNRLGNYPIEHVYTFEENGIIVKGTLPKKFYYTDILQVAADSLTSVKTAGNSIDITNFSIDERINILNTLPSSLFPKISEFLKAQEDIIKDDPLINFRTNMELPFGNTLDLQLYNGAVGEIIKMLFNTDLKELYTNEYTLMRRFKFTFNAIQQCTPQELNVYYEIIHKDLEREKKEQDEQEKGYGSGDFMAPPKNLQPE